MQAEAEAEAEAEEGTSHTSGQKGALVAQKSAPPAMSAELLVKRERPVKREAHEAVFAAEAKAMAPPS